MADIKKFLKKEWKLFWADFAESSSYKKLKRAGKDMEKDGTKELMELAFIAGTATFGKAKESQPVRMR